MNDIAQITRVPLHCVPAHSFGPYNRYSVGLQYLALIAIFVVVCRTTAVALVPVAASVVAGNAKMQQ